MGKQSQPVDQSSVRRGRQMSAAQALTQIQCQARPGQASLYSEICNKPWSARGHGGV